MVDRITLGPFVLEHRLDEGGMGVVWRGRHERQGTTVAVKVLLSQKARDQKMYATFRREVQAVARLNHPRIVSVFDYGMLSPEAERASGGELVAGSPYLVMEYASEGTLKQRQPASWAAARGVLLELLDALGHAHARGLIHRDLKPANVLLCGPQDARPGLKLSDFGIAHTSERNKPTMRETQTASEFETPSGTPLYMAPEQFTGQWRDYGPWTDLYALGVMAYELIVGRPPFTSESFMGLAVEHMERQVTEAPTRFPVPEALWVWLRQMLEKRRSDRFQRASDAAWALRALDKYASVSVSELVALPLSATQLGGASTNPALDVSIDVSFDTPSALDLPQLGSLRDLHASAQADAHSATVGEDEVDDPALSQRLVGMRETIDAAISASLPGLAALPSQEDTPAAARRPLSSRSLRAFLRAPTPATWRQLADDQPMMTLMGAGLGLFSLRDAPLVDREAERDLLWSNLLRACTTDKPHLVLLDGPAGFGKSHLARWLCERAHEVGTADVLKATHDPNAGPTHGLARMAANHFQCVGMPLSAALDRLKAQLKALSVTDPYEWSALCELIADRSVDPTHDTQQLVRFNSPTERYALLRRMISRVADQRATMLWLDDAHWSADSLAFALYMMKAVQTSRLPVLMIVTYNAALCGDVERQLIADLTQLERATARSLGPLPTADILTLLERFLGLSPDLAREVAQRVQGNPLLATKLIGDWIQQGVLRDLGQGFVLDKGSLLNMPSDLKLIWREQLSHALRDQPPATLTALEVGAILGQEVTWRELLPACINAGAFVHEALLEPLSREGLIQLSPDGWSFSHSLLRDALLATAQEQGRAPRLHRACANMLAKLYPQDRDIHGAQARRARHLLAAGELFEALAPLLVAARDASSRSEYTKATQLLDERDRALSALTIPDGDLCWVEAWLLRAEIAREQGQAQAAAHFAQRVLDDALPAALPRAQDLRAEAHLILAHAARLRGDRAAASTLAFTARAQFEERAHGRNVARCLLLLAIIHRERGESDTAQRLYEEAREHFEALLDPEGQGKCLLGLGHVYRQKKKLEDAKRCYQKARDIFQSLGNQGEIANALNGLAEVARYQGDVASAEEGYRRAVSIFESIDSRQSEVLQLNLGFLIFKRRDYAQAQKIFERVLAVTRSKPVQAIAHACMLPCLAFISDYAAWDTHYAAAARLLQETQLADPDIADLSQQSGHLLLQSAELARAKLAFEVALRQWDALKLGDSDQANVLRRLLTAL